MKKNGEEPGWLDLWKSWWNKEGKKPMLLPGLLNPDPKLWVHPGLSWVELETAAVEMDRCLEVFTIAVAAHASLD